MDLIKIFETFGFPIAVCIVLFVILAKVMQGLYRQGLEIQNKYVEHLEKSNKELIQCINENTKSLNNFSATMLEFAKNFKVEEGK